MAVFGQLVVMHLDEAFDGLLDGLHLEQRHLVVFGEKLEAFDLADVLEGFDDLFLGGGWRNVAQVQRRRGREDVGVVLAAGLLEAVQRRVAKVLRQPGVRLALLRHLHLRVFRRRHSNLFAPQLEFVQMQHGDRRLLRVRHLNQRVVFLVEQDLDTSGGRRKERGC